MMDRYRTTSALVFLLLVQGCTHSGLRQPLPQNSFSGDPTQVLAVYEPWFGHPRHMDVGYSSQDPVVVRKQIEEAKGLGISGFVVDWYGDREPFIDRSYALIQKLAAENKFRVAMMYDEADKESSEATDDALAAFHKFHESYLLPNSPGQPAYLTYNGRPMIFVFPKGAHTDWSRVREEINSWDPAPLLIYENRLTPYASAFDGFYAWVNPGKKGWAADGSHWGESYLRDFYEKMRSKYRDKIAVGGAWAGFDDSKAAWSLNRHMSQRCGQTLNDTFNLAREYYPADHPLPFLLVETWNDYEEGTAIERGLVKCGAASPQRMGQ